MAGVYAAAALIVFLAFGSNLKKDQ